VVTRFSVTRQFGIWDVAALRFGIGAVRPTLMPVFTGLFAALFLKRRQGITRWLGYAVIVFGLCLLIGTSGAITPDPLGVAALALAAAMWAFYTLLFRRSGLTPLQAGAMICIGSAILFLPAYMQLGLSRFRLAPVAEISAQVVDQGVLMSGVAIIPFNRAVTLLGPVAVTAIIALLPAAAAILAIPCLARDPAAAGMRGDYPRRDRCTACGPNST
jgi:drug/metabolite transporter (DMT)-like permease